MNIEYSRASDPWVGFAVQQLHVGTKARALSAYEGVFQRYADTASSKELHEEVPTATISKAPRPDPAAGSPSQRARLLLPQMRKSYVGLSECFPIDMTVATKIKMQRAFSAGMAAYGWAPQTFLLPADYPHFVRTHKARPHALWIIKQPEHNRGEGITMLSSLDQIQPGVGGPAPALIVQKYMERPMLIQGFKFHYRYYAMMANPPGGNGQGLVLLAFPLAPVRFSTAPYDVGAEGWATKNAHVTNSDANKKEVVDYCTTSPWQYRTISSALEYAQRAEPAKAELLRPRAVYRDSLRVISRAFGKAARMWEAPLPLTADGGQQPHRLPEDEFCHSVYGVDLMLDEQARVWLIEIQIKPQMDCSCDQDERVKDEMLLAMLRHDRHTLDANLTRWHSTRAQEEDLEALAARAEAEVAQWSEGEPEMLRLPLVQYDEDEGAERQRRFAHTYTY